MNWVRLINGFLLSFVFLIFFAYLVSGVQYVFGDFNQKVDNLPNTITHLILGFYFNQPINKLPKKLKRIQIPSRSSNIFKLGQYYKYRTFIVDFQ